MVASRKKAPPSRQPVLASIQRPRNEVTRERFLPPVPQKGELLNEQFDRLIAAMPQPNEVAATESAASEAASGNTTNTTTGGPAVTIDQIREKLHGSLAVRDVTTWHGQQVGTVTLAAEETLGHLAEWLKVPTQALRNLNGLSYNHQVQLGEKIRIPLQGNAVEEFEAARLEFHRSLQEDFFANYKIEGEEKYTVKRGDSIWQLSKVVLSVPVWLLQEYNGDTNLGNLIPGDVIRFPLVVPLNPNPATSGDEENES